VGRGARAVKAHPLYIHIYIQRSILPHLKNIWSHVSAGIFNRIYSADRNIEFCIIKVESSVSLSTVTVPINK
jgi:hypothetical protein